jgi:hypothetical protein
VYIDLSRGCRNRIHPQTVHSIRSRQVLPGR